MNSRLPAFEYPPARPEKGYWAPVTSTINWCEEDYYATIYSAEIVNTLTNLLFLWLGVKGIRNCLKYGHDRIFMVAFGGYLLVGSGSFAFHSTLKYPMQLVDELSMIYTASLMCYATLSFSRSARVRMVVGTALVSLAVTITLVYHYLKNPDFHQICFAIITATVLFRSIWVMEVNIRPSLKARWGMPSKLTETENRGNAKRDKAILKEMWLMVGLGLGIFLGGFGIWNLDNAFCGTIRRWRHQIGLPWGILLEGHGWWHLMTGMGAYFYIVWGIWLRHCLNERQDEFVLNWPTIYSIPEVVPVSVAETSKSFRKSTNGYTNGHMKPNGVAHANGDTKSRNERAEESRKSI